MLKRILSYIRRHGLMRPGDRAGVAVSGGADSVALLRLLLEARAELGVVLSVVHFNHRIRGAEADADEHFVSELARGFDLEFHSDSDDAPAYAEEHKLSLEDAARKLRYAFFDRLTADRTVARVATAHTRDDQAETVLMRFLRGSGTRGLAGIYPGIGGWIGATTGGQKPESPPAPRIVRPLLEVSRAELRAYLEPLGQAWREDASNLDTGFARNRLRHEILPVLRQLNPNLDQVLGGLAEIARAEESWWNQQVSAVLQGLWTAPPRQSSSHRRPSEPPRIAVDKLLAQPLAMQRRVVRALLESPDAHIGFEQVEAFIALAAAPPTRGEKVIELPHGLEGARQEGELWLRRRCPSTAEHGYALALRVPGEWQVAGRKIRASLVPAGHATPERPGAYVGAALLDASLQRGLCLRNWHAGDRYWPAHTREPKKLKELLQAPHIPRARKPFWPVVVSGEEIVWVPGFAAPERFLVREASSDALLLEELPSEGTEQ